ncbi:hypothetical protein NKH14_28160 [Mesorhizobium sp. M1380]|uniref:hypothetical protein n=1 Tax=Mesorhizobium sp. M1380 TaxID=2957093 RepID=UPI00333B07F0
MDWHWLVRRLVEEGKLIRITDLKLDAAGGHYLTRNDNWRLSPGAERLLDWLRMIRPKSGFVQKSSNSDGSFVAARIRDGIRRKWEQCCEPAA